MAEEARAMVTTRNTSRRLWRWWWLLPLACCFISWAASSSSTAAAAGVAVTSLPGFDGPLPFSLETGLIWKHVHRNAPHVALLDPSVVNETTMNYDQASMVEYIKDYLWSRQDKDFIMCAYSEQYVEVNESTGVRLYYYFIQSENNPDVDPLLLWLTGGPGCSSISGAAHEIGPFQFAAKRYYSGGLPRIIYRSETWTKVSNIIFVDSPVGAGFSYAATKEGSKSSDIKAVKQLLIFLRKWLHDHPRFSLNPLYIGGDSYSGIIVPTLTLAIDESNGSEENPFLNLKGYIAGNPVTDHHFDEDGRIPFLHGMGLISDELYEHAKETCGGKYSAPSNTRCAQSIHAIHDCTKDINMLHILEPLCEEVWSPIHKIAARDGMSRLMLESRPAAADDIIVFECRKASYVVLKIWANDETVRESLGVQKGTVGEWKRCNYDIDYNHDVHSTVDYHLMLMRKGYRAIIYSGDHDGGITSIGTQAWMRFLNLSIADDWRPWYVAGQVAGFTRSYASNNLTYATVKGAGHTAPEYKPKECLEMFARWISGNPL